MDGIPLIVLAAACAGLVIAVLVLAMRRPAAGSGAGAAEEAARLREDLREATVRAQFAAGLQEKLDAAEARAVAAEKELEAVRATAAADRRAHQEKVQELIAFREDMTKQFKALSQDALAAQSDNFTKANKERMEILLNPLREQITKFEKDFKDDGQQRVAQRTAMETLVQTLKEQTASVQAEAGNLARALKSSSQAQGAWGEMILKTILEKAGLREGEEFVTQDHQTTEEGGRHRPDVVVNFPDGKKLVVDSKVSLVAFERCVNCEDEAERAAHLKDHLTSLRRHIRGLSEKDYAQHYGGVDFVILFVPVEGALSLAIQNDPEIQADAVTRNVMIASPNTLLMGLRTVQNMWTRERQHQNAQAIAERAGKLYEKFVGFVDDLEKVGASIQRAHSQYDTAYGKLTSGRGNLIRQAELLKSMGAQTSKQLPEKMLAMSDDRDDDEAPEAPKTKPGKKGDAQHPERIPGLNGGKADSYDDLSEDEKLVADTISSDTDA